MNQMEIEDRYASGVHSKRNIQLVKGEGARLWDSEGNEYIDCQGGVGVASVGNANPHVAQAICEQAKRLTVASSAYYYNDIRAKLLQKLSEITPPGLSKSFLCNSGTEAVEASLKFARAHTGRRNIIACMRGFHGRTFGALSATWKKKYRKPFQPMLPGFQHVPFGDLKKLEEKISDKTAAILLEPIQGEGGVYPPPEGYLPGVREICNDHEVLLILDEVQTGFGRTGRMFACEHWAIVPDLMCVAKSMGGGLPIGACIMKEELKLGVGFHSSTFGGNPLTASAALAAINYIQENRLVELAQKRGRYFQKRLEELKAKREKIIREVRGLGLMLAIQLRAKSGSFLNKLIEHGVLATPAGSTVIRFLPPLEISKSDIEQVIQALKIILK